VLEFPLRCWRPCLAGNPACYSSTIYNKNFSQCSILVQLTVFTQCTHVYLYLCVGALQGHGADMD
jgi:hypothetical protein